MQEVREQALREWEERELQAKGTGSVLACWRVGKVAGVDRVSNGKAIYCQDREVMGTSSLPSCALSPGSFSMLGKVLTNFKQKGLPWILYVLG